MLASALHALGFRYRRDLRLALSSRHVRPDIVFTRRKIAIFVDGCFWHVCPVHGRYPLTNVDYWTPKLDRNRARDAADNAALVSAGWTVIRVWEHLDTGSAVKRIEHVFDDRPVSQDTRNDAPGGLLILG
jgi:DNA mismatch endonuclease (patch repair protein)